MKRSLLVSLVAASVLSATEYNMFIISLDSPNYKALNKIKDKVQTLMDKYEHNEDSSAIKAKPAYTYAKDENDKLHQIHTYHTVAVETKDINLSQAKAMREYLRANTKYKDVYFLPRTLELEMMQRYEKQESLRKAVKEGKLSEKSALAQMAAMGGGAATIASKAAKVADKPTSTKPAPKAAKSSSLDSLGSGDSLAMPRFAGSGAISLNDAVNHVLSTNPSIKASQQEYLLALKDLDIASAAYYPMLDLYANAGYAKKNEKTHGTKTRDGSGAKYDASLVLTENLYNGGKDMNVKKQQSHIVNSTAYRLIHSANELSYDTTKAYLDYIKADMLLQISKDNVKAHEEIYELIKDRTSAGFARASEERQAGSRLALARTNLLSAQNDYEDAKNTFTRVYGRYVDVNELAMPTSPNLAPSSLELTSEISRRCNPALKIEEENISALNYAYKASKSAYAPKLDLELSAKYDNNKIYKKIQQDQEEKQLGAFLRFHYNIFNKGQDKLQVQKTQVNMQSGRLNYESKLRALNESNSFAYNSYELSEQKMQHLNSYVEYAKQTLITYQDEFKLGKRDLINVLDAQNEYFNALKETISTQNTILLSEYKLVNNMGVIADSFDDGYASKYLSFACTIKDIH